MVVHAPYGLTVLAPFGAVSSSSHKHWMIESAAPPGVERVNSLYIRVMDKFLHHLPPPHAGVLPRIMGVWRVDKLTIPPTVPPAIPSIIPKRGPTKAAR